MTRTTVPPAPARSVRAGGLANTCNERPAGQERPLRIWHMKDSQGKKRGRKPVEQAPGASQDSPAASYTPEQRRLIRNGLRIWARVAIRSYLRKHAGGSRNETEPTEEED